MELNRDWDAALFLPGSGLGVAKTGLDGPLRISTRLSSLVGSLVTRGYTETTETDSICPYVGSSTV